MDATSGNGKPKFRARKLDPARSLKIIRYSEIDEEDAEELLGGSMRAAVVIATGVDKEEEEEEHLQTALTTAMVASKDQQYVIPTPDVQPLVADYELLYPTGFKPSKTYFKAAVRMTDSHDSHLADPKIRPSKYNADHEDIEFCTAANVPLETFEVILEWCNLISHETSEASVTVENCLINLEWLKGSEHATKLEQILHYWNSKRPVMSTLKYEDIGKIGSDPFVCFRRRELRQPRKTRRSDAQCVDRIRKLRFELECIQVAMSVAIKRDKWKLQSLQLEQDIFSQYCLIESQRDQGFKLPESILQLPSFKEAISLPFPQHSLPAGSTAIKKPAKRKAEQRHKISLPVAAFKSLKYSRPYYPVEMLKLLQRDLDGIQESPNEDLLPSLWKSQFCDQSDALYYRMAPSDLPNSRSGTTGAIRARRGRSGRLLLDYEPDYSAVLLRETKNPIDLPVKLSLLSLKECSQLNNQSIGNYNHHYIQSTVHLTKPYTFFGWLTATSGLQAASGKPRSSAGNAAPSSANTSRTSSPTKRSRLDSPLPPASNPSSSSAPTTNSNSGAMGNIIVKVKKSGGGSGGEGQPSTPPNSTNTANQAKRFTPNGLSPGE